MLGVEGCVSSHLATIVADEKQAHPRFLLYFLSTIAAQDLVQDHAYPSLNLPTIAGIEVHFPPLAEQQRIVGLLDEAFAGLATAKANAEKNLQNARALFESHIQSVFTQRGPGWVEKHLKEVCEKITDGTHQTPKYFDEGIVFLSSRNVTSGTIDWDRIKYIDTKQHLEMHKRVAPRRNDILLAKNGTTGVAAIVDRDTTFDIYVSLALLRALPVMRPRFLLHFINSPAAKVQFNKRLKGVGVPNLHLEEIREVRLAFPADLKAQDRVVDELDDFREETQRLARLYERKHAALEALKKSLLHQAFTGEL
ncbi:MAG: restriction endonuclease subunit S [Planctomycetes bacterium]|nr:restriction endonuclease subunit S [Planctomycetota bacterium]